MTVVRFPTPDRVLPGPLDYADMVQDWLEDDLKDPEEHAVLYALWARALTEGGAAPAKRPSQARTFLWWYLQMMCGAGLGIWAGALLYG